MKRTLVMALVAAGSIAGLSGANAQEKITIGVSYQNLAFPFVAALQKAAQNACAALDVECIEADAVNDTAKELTNVESMLAKGINCLAFEAASLEASVASINAANAKGVPVVQFNGKAAGGDYVTFVGSAQTDSGAKLGQFLEKLHKSSGKERLRGIYLHGVAGQITDIARSEGLKNYLSGAGLGDKIEFVEQYADYDRGKGQAVTESLLTKDKNYDFIVANNDDMILGALQTVNQFGLKIPMAGVDGLPEALAAIKKGQLAATVFQDPEGQGGGGIWGCYLATKGVKLPKEFLIPFTLVDSSNVDDFVAIADRVYVK
ncbi:MAG: sugar ABC transporter substrate-binding protein [Rhizobiaceae bacterium]|nr:sugar ABC transporter substrate-binding protein [Rhizobiaceae bacterium]